MPRTAHDDQARRWNGTSGRAWVDAQDILDGMFRPVEELLATTVPAGGAHRVLDVGCGTGGTTVAIARRLGAGGTVVGIDISTPMLAAARRRASLAGAPADFVRADAEDHAFEPGRFDVIVSRFGVMFFADPVRAFANLRSAGRPEARLRVIAWRGPADNPFMTAAERAVAPALPELPVRRPDGPGQFAFGDERRVRDILDGAGWSAVEVTPLDVDCDFPEADLIPYLTRLGPVGAALEDADAAARERITRLARAAFDPFVHGDRVRFRAACWDIRAVAPARSRA